MSGLGPVLVLEPVSERGLELLRGAGLEVLDASAEDSASLDALLERAVAIIVRSGTQVDAAFLARCPRLRAVARAGAGLDNVDLDEATRLGIAVLNTPGGNAIAAAELTLGLMLAMVRKLAHGHAELAKGRWERHQMVGVELSGRTLGILGLGRIGSLVAARAQAFDMQVLACDPYLSEERAESLGVEKLELDEMLARCDLLSLHLPLGAGTEGLIGPAEIARMRPSAFLVNCARGGLVDEAALLEALDGDRLAGAALDVYSQEPPGQEHPLIAHPKVVHTPHLGASTLEAKENVSLDAAHGLIALLRDDDWSVAVNLPHASPALKHLAPELDLAERLGRFQSGLLDGPPTHAVLELSSDGEEDPEALLNAFLCGLLHASSPERVNPLNARMLAAQLGITVAAARRAAEEGFPRRLIARVEAGESQHLVEGALLARGEPRVVRLDGHWIDLMPAGDLLVMRNQDLPGVMGRVGTLLGSHDINIGELRMGRRESHPGAVSVWQVDEPVAEEVLEELRALEAIHSVRQVHLGAAPRAQGHQLMK